MINPHTSLHKTRNIRESTNANKIVSGVIYVSCTYCATSVAVVTSWLFLCHDGRGATWRSFGYIYICIDILNGFSENVECGHLLTIFAMYVQTGCNNGLLYHTPYCMY